jgi:hypothetical protein
MGALVAGVLLAPSASAAPPRHTFVLNEGARTPAVVGNSLFYLSDTRTEEVVKRLDLTTGQRARVFGRRSGAYSLGALRAGGGRVAVEVDDNSPRGGLGSAVVELDPTGAPPHTLARGVLRTRARCGLQVSLEDVSQDGAVLVDRTTIECSRRARDRHVLERYGIGPPTELVRWVERSGDEGPAWRLAATRLLKTTEHGVRVTDLVTRQIRRFRPSRRGSVLGFGDLDSSGNLTIAQLRFRRRSMHEVLRLLRPTDSLASGRVLFDGRTSGSEPRFCGTRLVEHRVSPATEELFVHDDPFGPPRQIFSSTRPGATGLDLELGCDPDTAVIADAGHKQTVIEVVPLAP